ncbi:MULTISPECIES: hypothetical protein [Sphingomonas]|uniref:Uncharacterized protein n=1 Tax=Sphingomonas mollis TaxID=2795726 RepID=A0ABS0XMA9_9SPHN|nr:MULTISPECIES: hypothetical protein [unclassified Sphingomonas]KQU55698.1 hypothetical protein ASG67_06095 [Sphingomonas sp. Leaf339]MBJ6120945.1 hypothetical protein [Sphingomonas sp. BT553]
MDVDHASTSQMMQEASPFDSASDAPVRAQSTVERAYQLARQGPCTTLDDIRRQLEQERYASVNAHLSGPTIRRQLRQICRDRIVRPTPTE